MPILRLIKAKLIKVMWYWHEIDKKIKGTEQNPEIEQLIFNKGAEAI